MTMFLAIGKFFSELFQLLLGACSAVMKWAREHPRELVIVLVSIALILATAFYTHKWTEAKVKAADAKVIAALQTQVEKANADTKARDEKIDRIEKQSKQDADTLQTKITDSKAKADAIVSDYKRKLDEEKQKYKVVYVKDKDGIETPVTVDTQGAVICDKFSNTFFDTVNSLVDNANAPIQPETTK
jgi:hypothetical protein